MPNDPIADIVTQTAQTAGLIFEGGVDIANNMSKQAEFARNIQDIQTQNAQDVHDLAVIHATSTLKNEQANLKAANILGTDLNSVSEKITSLTNVASSAYADKMAALDRIQQKDSVSLADNPIQYLINQITVNQDIRQHNDANEKLNAAQSQIATLNALTQTQIATNNALKESVNSATIEAFARTQAAAAQTAAQKAAIEGASYNNQGIQSVLNAKKEQLDLMFKANSAQIAQQQLDIERQNLTLHQQEFDWRKDEKKISDEARAMNLKVDDFLSQTIQAGRVARGAQPLSTDNLKIALTLLKSNSPAGKMFQEDYTLGESARTMGTPVLGASPYQVMDTITKLPVNLPSIQEPVRDFLKTEAGRFEQSLPASGIDIKNKAAVEQAFNAFIKNEQARQTENVKVGDATNIFAPAPMSQIVKHPEVQKSVIYNQVLKPAMDLGYNLDDPNKVMGLVVEAVSNGTITYNNALETTLLYHVGTALNNEARNFVKFGLNPAFTYKTRIEYGVPGTSEIVDMTKADQVGRALNRALVYKALPDMTGE